jgi:hypothetical protein
VAIWSATATRRLSPAAGALGLFFLWHAVAGAKATLTITLPEGAVRPAGPDFATDVLKDAWDFSNAEDLSPDPGETSNWCNAADVANATIPNCFGKTAFALANGLAGGTAKTDDATLGLLFTGFNNVINPGRTGLSFPIDTSKYKKLAFRMSADVAGNDPQIYWFPIAWLDPQDAAVPPDFDRNFGVTVASKTVLGFKTFLVDLSAPPLAGTLWTSKPMKGLRLDPNNTPGGAGLSTGAGHTFFYDWVRLTYADSDPAAAKQTIQWSGGTGATTIDVYDGVNSTLIVNVASGLGGASTSWNYGVLPPGTYTLRVSRTDGSTGTQAFTVNTPPTVSVTSPSRTTGADYATTVLGSAWDMNGPSDIVVIGSENFTPDPPDFTGGILSATNTNSDPNVTLLHNFNNANGTKAIDTLKFRYLTYRMSIDGPVDITNGSIARVHWGSGQFPSNFTTTRDIFVFAGMQSYTIDLATLTSTPIAPFGGFDPNSGTCAGQPLTCTQEPWTTNRKTQLRFDPDEFGTNPNDPMPTRTFHIDDIKLTAKPVSSGSFTIQFAAADADAGDTLTVNLFRTTDTVGSNKTLIASNVSPASGQFVWNTTAVPQGEYFVLAEVTDGKNAVASYSDAPVVVTAPCTFSLAPAANSVANGGGAGSTVLMTGPLCDWTATSNAPFITLTSPSAGTGTATISYSVPPDPARTARSGTMTIGGQTLTVTQLATPAPFDFDGDGRADRTVFTPGTGVWKTQNGATRQFGWPGDIPVPGDYNGDGVPDTAVYRPSTGDWFVQGVTTFNWGLPGDIPVPGDFDGDGITDAAVFRTTGGIGGTFYVRNQFVKAWGLRGDIPLAGDFDGDGKSDLVAYRPTTGQWFVLLSSAGFNQSVTYQFGAPGDIPIIGDFDGDRKTDLAVYRPSTGEWFMVFSSTGFGTGARYVWGAPGDVPMALDMDGDRVDDLVVFRPSNATWWTFNRVSGATDATQFGATGDQPAPLRPQIRLVPTSDFDGDRKADLTVFRPSTGDWFTLFSSTGYTTAQQLKWGMPGDVKVPGDYDGDGRTDVAVFRPSTGQWFIRFSSTGYSTSDTEHWGLPGDIPVPGDYDGDGKTDLAVFRPSTGQWFVAQSSTGYTTFTVDHFGLSGDTPAPADFDGDARTDLAVYRPSTGQWFIKPSSGVSGGLIVKQFGLPSDIPIPSDWDGDGRAELAVYRPSTGQWFGADALTTIVYTTRVLGAAVDDIPVADDFDGDGVVDAAVFRSSGKWIVLLSTTGGTTVTAWGTSGDQPLWNPGGGGQ